jgi:hypothetical protein
MDSLSNEPGTLTSSNRVESITFGKVRLLFNSPTLLAKRRGVAWREILGVRYHSPSDMLLYGRDADSFERTLLMTINYGVSSTRVSVLYFY